MATRTRAGLTVDRIVEAAAALADEVGFEKVTISALARGFGVKDASLYSHVENLQDVRTRIALLAAEEMSASLASAIAGRSAEDALTAFADAYRDYARDHPGRYAAARLRLDPETARASAAVRHSQMTRAILRGYDFVEPDETDAVRLLGSTFHGYVTLETGGSFSHTPRDTQDTWTAILDALDALLRNWPKSGPGDGASADAASGA